MPKFRSRHRRGPIVATNGQRDQAWLGTERKRQEELFTAVCPACNHGMRHYPTCGYMCERCGARLTVEQARRSMKGRAQVAEQQMELRRAEVLEESRKVARVEAEDLSHGGVVYYIRFCDAVKIGTSKNPASRLQSLPWSELLAMEPGSVAVERMRHLEFASDRLEGEWFSVSDGLLEHARGLVIANAGWLHKRFPRIVELPCARNTRMLTP